MFTDQVPDEDMSRALAAKHRVMLWPTIREAVTMTSNTSTGGRALAVDGVVLICEHGAYPYNPLGQKMYPRCEFFRQVMDVFREAGRTAPVFNGKHLSYEWPKAKWMYDQAPELKFPLMAGSALPLARDPLALVPLGAPLERAALTWQATFFDNKDSYGFHALERRQSLVERREGGETGFAAVQCHGRERVWEWMGANPCAGQLLGALGGSGPARDKVKDPLLFLLEYRSGLQAGIFRLNGWQAPRTFAASVRGKAEPLVLADEETILPGLVVPESLKER